MAVTKEESDKLLARAQTHLDELRDPKTVDMERKHLLAGRIAQLVRWATNISLVVDPETKAMSGRFIPKYHKTPLPQLGTPIDPDNEPDCLECANGMVHDTCRTGWRAQLAQNKADWERSQRE